MWQREYGIETTASPEVIWNIFPDVPGWKNWNAGIEHIEINGPFEVGTEFVMTPPGQQPLSTRLIKVKEYEGFVDQTRVGDVLVDVAHRIERLNPERTRIVYAVQVIGPAAEDIGRAVSTDFPDVLKALAALAESKKAI
jgi:hypothetical protein